jgi:hypothetical protein
MRRGFWFLAGAGAGVYTAFRVRRVMEAFTPDGLRDRLAGLSLGARLLGEDVSAAMADAENDLRRRLGVGLDGLEAAPRHRAVEAGGTAEPERELTRKGND